MLDAGATTAPPSIGRSAVEVVAVIDNGASRCELQKHDGDEFDSLALLCGDAVQHLGKASKGITVDRLNGCQIVLQVAAVNFPRLLTINNCGKSVKVSDLGQTWAKQLHQAVPVKAGAVEYVSYAAIPRQAGCYSVQITYDKYKDRANTPFSSKTGTFCVPLRR